MQDEAIEDCQTDMPGAQTAMRGVVDRKTIKVGVCANWPTLHNNDNDAVIVIQTNGYAYSTIRNQSTDCIYAAIHCE